MTKLTTKLVFFTWGQPFILFLLLLLYFRVLSFRFSEKLIWHLLFSNSLIRIRLNSSHSHINDETILIFSFFRKKQRSKAQFSKCGRFVFCSFFPSVWWLFLRSIQKNVAFLETEDLLVIVLIWAQLYPNHRDHPNRHHQRDHPNHPHLHIVHTNHLSTHQLYRLHFADGVSHQITFPRRQETFWRFVIFFSDWVWAR